jgi:hypothetical protein
MGDPVTAAAPQQTCARYPDVDGFVERGGVRVHWAPYGAGLPTFLLLPTWEIVHSRCWKCQIPYLARHGTVVTFDPRVNGHDAVLETDEGWAQENRHHWLRDWRGYAELLDRQTATAHARRITCA